MDSKQRSMMSGLRGILGLGETSETPSVDWKRMVIAPDEVLDRVEPGMSIFLGTGAAEPRTLVKHLMASDRSNLTDLELIQLVSFGDAISLDALNSQKCRLKTFFAGWIASEAITEGRVDLIPSRFANIPGLIQSGKINIDVAFIQITPPSPSGYCSLGIGVDVARKAIEQADLVVGEINASVPVTYGDTFVHVSEFDALVEGTEPAFHFSLWGVDETFDRVAANVASVIEDGSCIAFSMGMGALSRVPRGIRSSRVFLWRGKPMNDVKKAFKTACTKAGLNDFTFHDLRHCAINNLRLAGNDYFKIMAISGHKTMNVFKRYNLVTEEELSSVTWQDQVEGSAR
jgi:hypothetical protein